MTLVVMSDDWLVHIIGSTGPGGRRGDAAAAHRPHTKMKKAHKSQKHA